MLNTSYDKFNIEKFTFGLATLTVTDNRRGNDHMTIVKDFIEFIKFDSERKIELQKVDHLRAEFYSKKI